MESRVSPDMTEVRVSVNLLKKIISIKNHKIINKNIKIVNLEILKVKTWFWNKDLSSLDSIN